MIQEHAAAVVRPVMQDQRLDLVTESRLHLKSNKTTERLDGLSRSSEESVRDTPNRQLSIAKTQKYNLKQPIKVPSDS